MQQQPQWSGYSPLPTTEHLKGIWGSPSGAIWAVGHSGVILRHDGSGWKLFPSPTGEHLRSVWGSSSADLWAVGEHVTGHHASSKHAM